MTTPPPSAPPTDPSIERSVLALLLHGHSSTRAKILADTEAADFHTGMNPRIYTAISAIVRSAPDADEQVVLSRLATEPQHRGGTELSTWGMALADLISTRPDAGMAGHYVTQLREIASRRQLWESGSEQMRLAHDATTVAEAQEAASRGVFAAIQRDNPASRRITSAASIERFTERYLAEDGGGRRIPWPIPRLNDLIGAQRSPWVIVSGGYSGDGKTWWLLDCVEEAAKHVRCALFEIEMSDNEITERYMAMGGHNYTAVQDRLIPSGRIQDRSAEVAAMDRVTFPGGWTAEGIRLELGRAAAEGRPFGYVAIDHLHILSVPGRAGDYRVELNKALTSFKEMAQEFECVVHIAGQLSRQNGVGAAAFPTPHMAMLRETGAIEQIADRVLFIHRDRDERGKSTRFGNLIVGKSHSSQPADAMMIELNRSMRFREVGR